MPPPVNMQESLQEVAGTLEHLRGGEIDPSWRICFSRSRLPRSILSPSHLHTAPAQHICMPYLHATPAHHTFMAHLHATPACHTCTALSRAVAGQGLLLGASVRKLGPLLFLSFQFPLNCSGILPLLLQVSSFYIKVTHGDNL